jgi:chaperonin GroES
MKTKLYKILGVALTVVLLASLTVGLAGAPAGAVSSNLKFTKLDLPRVEVWNNEATFAAAEGDYWVTPNADVGSIAITPEGDVLFAEVFADNWAFFEVMKSLDDGYTWKATGFWEEWDNQGDPFAIVDIVTSSEYGDDTTVVVATQWGVYISDDGGDNFVLIGDTGTDFNGGPITDLDVAIAEDGDLALMVCSDDNVYIKKGLLGWIDQNLDNAAPPVGVPLAGAFLPTFADDGDIGICAVCTDGATTTMTFSYDDTGDPAPAGGWGTSGISNAPITNAEGGAFPSELAVIAFPEDFDAFGIGTNVCFVGVCEVGALGADSLPYVPPAPPDGSDAYKIICKEAGPSDAVDLDVRGVETTLLPTATAITSIDVCGNAEEATILVGTDCCNLADTPTYWFVYYSQDSGDSWQFSFKQPTGGDETFADLTYIDARTQVLMAPDFCGGSTAYCSTMDWGGPIGTSAFQRTINGAASWNQVSCIDYAWTTDDYWVTQFGFSASGYNADGTLRMITWSGGDYGTMWQRFDGEYWEAIISYASPGVTDQLFQISAPMDGSALFAVDHNNCCMWRSTDGGDTWPKKINTKGGLIIPDTAKEKPAEGEVVSCGEGARKDSGELIAMSVKAGDRVLFGKWSGTEVTIDGAELLIMKESDILGILS